LESPGTFGNLVRFWKPCEVLENYRDFGNLWRFCKPIGILESSSSGYLNSGVFANP